MASTPHSGIEVDELSADIRPQDDLFRHVNSRWIAATEIPPDRAAHGAFHALDDQAELDVRALAEEAAASDSPAGSEARKVGDLWASFMDADGCRAARRRPGGRRPGRDPGGGVDHRPGPPARAPRAPRHARARRLVRRHRRRRRHPLHRQPRAGRARAARRGLLPRGRLRRGPRRLRRARGHDVRPRRRARAGRRRPPAARAGDRGRQGPLDDGRQPRRAQDLQQAVPRAARRAGARHRLGRLARRPRCAGGGVRRGHRPPARRGRDRRPVAHRAAPRRLAGVAGFPPRPGGRPVPVEPLRRRELRLLRHAALGHPRAAASAGSAASTSSRAASARRWANCTSPGTSRPSTRPTCSGWWAG